MQIKNIIPWKNVEAPFEISVDIAEYSNIGNPIAQVREPATIQVTISRFWNTDRFKCIAG